MLGHFNDFFIFITPRCSTLTPWFFVSGFGIVSEFCVCCRVLGFHRLITFGHFTHTHTTMLDAYPTIFCFRVSGLVPSFEFVVEFWIFIDWSHPNIQHTHTTMLDAHPTIFRFWVSRGPFFRGPIFRGPFFPGTIFRGPFFRDSIYSITCLQMDRV